MKTLNVTVICNCFYNSTIQVPEEMSLEEAIAYAKEHLEDIPIKSSIEWFSDQCLDEDNCDFNE